MKPSDQDPQFSTLLVKKLILTNSKDPDKMPHSWSSLFVKVPVYIRVRVKGIKIGKVMGVVHKNIKHDKG